jgi:hypothetical protein
MTRGHLVARWLCLRQRATRLTADRASRSFEFTEREPETDRINDKTKNEDEHNHFTSSQAYSLRLNGVASNSVPLFVQRDVSLLCYRHYPAVLKTPRDPNEFRRTLCDQLSQLPWMTRLDDAHVHQKIVSIRN